jgi:thioredoxin reductase
MNFDARTSTPSETTDVAIIGAGPYGLSIAANLTRRKVPFRIFGKPMESWRTQMPRGMLLKSDGFASNLYDPEGSLTLAQYCREKGLPYADTNLPVPLETFCDYGVAFQQRFVPTLEHKVVELLETGKFGFTLKLDDHETVEARRVVVAVGISHFADMPWALAGLPSEVASHSSQHAVVNVFKGTDVVVVGGGASAVDLAALLHEAGANVLLVARKAVLPVHGAGTSPRSLRQRLRAPSTGIGPSWKSWFFTHCATIFHRLPEATRIAWVQTHLGPAGGWFMNERVGRVPQLLGHTPIGATMAGNRVQLKLSTNDGQKVRTVEADHVIAATGYRPKLSRLAFIEPRLRASIKTETETPILSSKFQSSVPGLYFVGPIAANSFGPMMRFAYGAGYTARRISRHLPATGKANQ